MRILIILCFSLLFHCSHAQSVKQSVSASYLMLNSYSQKHNDAFSFTHNTAALAFAKAFSAGVLAETRYMLKETNYYSGVAVVPTELGNFGVEAGYFGYKNFNEYQIGLAYARSLGSSFSLGAGFNYYSYRVPAYQQGGAVTFQIGAIARISDQLTAGIEIYNPVGGYISKSEDEKLASNYRLGIGYEPTENVIVSATIEKEENKDINVTAGVFYQFDDRFFARAGMQSLTKSPFGAAGVSFDEIRLDLSVSYHQQLGFSPGIMVIYQPAKKKK
ncbi:MAG: hypothetical protein LC100_07470 [Chitinophagales bacterium]|nr:hypothetical protein [Chitinophagales bacterium]